MSIRRQQLFRLRSVWVWMTGKPELIVPQCFAGFRYTSRVNQPSILLGTSSFTAKGWEASFYPKGMRSSDYLAFYAERFHTVEVDSTFYACPSARTVANWAATRRAGLRLREQSLRGPRASNNRAVPTSLQWKGVYPSA